MLHGTLLENFLTILMTSLIIAGVRWFWFYCVGHAQHNKEVDDQQEQSDATRKSREE
jgi:hypothetical protein